MEKRYQVFVSSTYEDLQEERREVMQALLELDCIPAGMELFPASNEDQWSLIKKVIDDCDYYIVIIGGRYGSLNAEGISFTEMEYHYAVETGKPIIAFLHKKPEELKSKYTEQTPEGKAKLEAFRKLAEKKMVKHWTNPSELGSVVSRSMVKLTRNFPATGWIKADEALNEITSLEILRIREENLVLKNKLSQSSFTAPPGSEKLAQGEDTLSLELVFSGETKNYSEESLSTFVNTNWNRVFASIAPYLSIEADEETIEECLVEHLKTVSLEYLRQIKQKYRRLTKFSVYSDDFQRIKVQFKALGLIEKSDRGKSVKNVKSYWTLTEYGDYIMTQLVAIKRD